MFISAAVFASRKRRFLPQGQAVFAGKHSTTFESTMACTENSSLSSKRLSSLWCFWFRKME